MAVRACVTKHIRIRNVAALWVFRIVSQTYFTFQRLVSPLILYRSSQSINSNYVSFSCATPSSGKRMVLYRDVYWTRPLKTPSPLPSLALPVTDHVVEGHSCRRFLPGSPPVHCNAICLRGLGHGQPKIRTEKEQHSTESYARAAQREDGRACTSGQLWVQWTQKCNRLLLRNTRIHPTPETPAQSAP